MDFPHSINCPRISRRKSLSSWNDRWIQSTTNQQASRQCGSKKTIGRRALILTDCKWYWQLWLARNGSISETSGQRKLLFILTHSCKTCMLVYVSLISWLVCCTSASVPVSPTDQYLWPIGYKNTLIQTIIYIKDNINLSYCTRYKEWCKFSWLFLLLNDALIFTLSCYTPNSSLSMRNKVYFWRTLGLHI